MQQGTTEENHLVLLGDNSLVVPGAEPAAIFAIGVVDTQLSAFKGFRLVVKEVHESEFAGGDLLLRVVAVLPEKIAVITGGNLALNTGRGKGPHEAGRAGADLGVDSDATGPGRGRSILGRVDCTATPGRDLCVQRMASQIEWFANAPRQLMAGPAAAKALARHAIL